MDDKFPPSYQTGDMAGNLPALEEFNEGFVPDEEPSIEKPPTAPPFQMKDQEALPIINLGEISAEDIREACIQYASEHCCYGKRFARNTELSGITNMCAFHYKLETFGEKRESVLRSEPFKGQPIDGPENGPPPGPWDIFVSIPELFVDGHAKLEIPHTAYVRECSTCVGNGRVRCRSCAGRGGSTCGSCFGSGHRDGRPCASCGGSGRRRCFSCNGTGQVRCRTCKGHGKLRFYRLLIVTWINHVEHFISETSNLPKALITRVGGREMCKEQNPRIWPINSCPDFTVNEASRQLIEKHTLAFPNELIRMQRHILRAVPLTRANYSWKSKQGELYVYGFQKKVYFENYPQKCCCCTCL